MAAKASNRNFGDARKAKQDEFYTQRPQPHGRIGREPASQVSADLLRTPPLHQEFADDAPRLSVLLDSPTVLAGSACNRATVSIERSVTAVPTT